MDDSAPRSKQIRDEFARRQRRQYLVSLPTFCLFLLFIVFNDPKRLAAMGLPSNAAVVVLLGVIAVLGVFTFWNWRCPACNRYLGKKARPKLCRRCGVRLQ